MGEKFASVAKQAVAETLLTSDWQTKIERAKKFLKFNEQYFPSYVDEIKGYAKGASVDFLDLYTLGLEDEVDQDYPSEKCTTLITNGGKLLAHNEDWDKGSENKICLVQKTIGDTTILELFYYNTLGGNSVSINSNGYIVAVNSMVSNDVVLGVSKNFVSRWLSETKDPDTDIAKLKNLPRSQGHNINILHKSGAIWNIEYSSHHIASSNPSIPFVHSNHYLSEISQFEANTNKNGTFDRFRCAKEKIKREMSIRDITELMGDQSVGEIQSLMNERTIAKIIVDLENSLAKIWLLREPGLDFVDYDLKTIF